MNNTGIFKSEDGKATVLNSYSQLLAKCTAPYEEMHVKTRYGMTYIIASGDPSLPPLILLHGSGSNLSMWVGDMAKYAQHYRVFAVDIPGDPGKSEEKQYALNSPAYAEWMDDVLHSLQLQQASFVGISLGAWMIINFAVKHPAKVAKMVLISPSGIGPQKISFIFKVIPLMLLGEKGKDKVTRLVNGNQSVPEEALKHLKLISRHYKFRSGTVPVFTDSELSGLPMPILLIAGEQDVMLHSKKTADRLSKLAPHAQINLIPDQGHVLINLTHRILPFLLPT